MYEKELKRILDASQRNALSFFVGAGVSALSNAPTWKDLIDAICDKMGLEKKSKYSSDEYLQIPQMFYYSLGESETDYNRFIKEQLFSANLVPNEIHREMFDLNPASFITTNYDTLLEDASSQYCQSFKAISCDKDVPKIYGDRFILKVHGDFSNNNFVLKEEDYLNYSENFKLIETLAKAIFSTNTVVFIGYGLNDYNIKLILNWAKTLLKDDFREPIFLYTSNEPLTKEELLYQKSKGLSVIEWNKLSSPSSSDYLSRYQLFFETLKKLSKSTLEGKTAAEAFETLFNLLDPLNKLNALRIKDVSSRLSSYVSISENGVIYIHDKKCVLLNDFIEINQMTKHQQANIDKCKLKKYRCILSVFKKARIFEIRENNKNIRIISDIIPLADTNCIIFNYSYMDNFVSEKYTSIEKNYQKAYYLSRLKRYDEAFYLFYEVAKKAFNEKNYLLYYLAESNCISLKSIIKNVNFWYHCYDISRIESLSSSDSESENLFRNLPVEFQNTYDSLKDIHSVNMLYRYSYESFVDGQKLSDSIESETMEYGLTSSGKAVYKINDYLHFLQRNGIIADSFSEYKNTVKNLMSKLIYKYMAQGKITLHEKPFPYSDNKEVYFDEFDFYCFIECFNDKEIKKLFSKHEIKTLEFHNIDRIETAICNLLDFYEYVVKTSKNNVDVISFQDQIKTCLMLLRYMNISQRLVDKTCKFIFTHEFRDLYINDKVFFLDYQLIQRKMFSETTAKIIEDTLISYIDNHISALENGDNYDIPSTYSGINYFNLVHYIYPGDKEYTSRRLSIRVSKILNKNLSQLYPHIINHYYRYVSKCQKRKLILWANKQLAEKFNFDLFIMLISYNIRISSAVINQLKVFLKNQIKPESKRFNGITVYPPKDRFEELKQVGYLCLIKDLNAKDFEEFLGSSPVFDFYCEYTNFDFSRFEVSWLLNLYPHVLKEISKDQSVKEKIRMAIADKLKSNNLVESDSKKLQNILVNYFC